MVLLMICLAANGAPMQFLPAISKMNTGARRMPLNVGTQSFLWK